MDIRQLLKASQTGDVPLLHQLLAVDPQLLHNASLASGEDPLFVASAAGHVDFVKVILERKPSLAKELNKDGFSPMHVASANGYMEIVRAMLRAEPECSQVKGKDQCTPLHCAARRGRVEIIREIVSACPDSIEDVTVLRETVLHLAAKNSQFEAMKVLLELVQEMNRLHVLNMKDNLGNSVLHLATGKKQHQVVEWLVGIGTASGGVLEVDSVNQKGLTALDVLLLFHSEAGDREIEEILRGDGSDPRARVRVQSSSDLTSYSQNPNQMASQTQQQQPHNVTYTAADIVQSSSDVPSLGHNQNQMAPQTNQGQVASTAIDIVHPLSNAPSLDQNHNHIAVIDHPLSDVPSSLSQNQNQMAPQTNQEQQNNVSLTSLALVHPIPSDQSIGSPSQNHTPVAPQTPEEEEEEDLMEYFKFHRGRDSPSDVRTVLLVVAVLVATASYAIALNPPGGLWSDTNLSTNGTEPPHLAGTSNIASYYPLYSVFGAIFNCIGFSVSLQMIYILTTGFPLRLELIVSGLAMYVTYINGLITISPGEGPGWYSWFILTPALPPVILIPTKKVIKLIIKLRESRNEGGETLDPV